jgi:hypothetical protein
MLPPMKGGPAAVLAPFLLVEVYSDQANLRDLEVEQQHSVKVKMK